MEDEEEERLEVEAHEGELRHGGNEQLQPEARGWSGLPLFRRCQPRRVAHQAKRFVRRGTINLGREWAWLKHGSRGVREGRETEGTAEHYTARVAR